MPRTFALALLASSALVSAAHARELPTGGQLAAGAATIANPATGPMTITQTSNRAVINWQSFSVGVGDTVNIVQPGSTSALLNRVTGATTSTIAGQIHANGQVFLVNPNGILITATGSVNGAGFVASTLDLTDRQFMAGDITVNGRGGSVINRGSISIAKGGFAALIGGHVDNSGLILAPLGRVALGSGSQATLDLTGDGFLQVAIPAASQGGITMSGRISADGGSVILSTASARDAARLTINLSGTIEAHSVTGHSGAVVLTGGAITLTGARIDVSGATGGGTVRIGGDRQGGGNLAHADTVSIDAASTIDANATVAGNGGNVVVWSDTATQFAGTISARGIGGGNGGNAEVSSHGRLGYTGSTDLTGRSFGTLLLDPFNLTISNAADSNQNGFTATGNDSVINATTLTNALGSANVTISTGSSGLQSGTITVAAPLAWTTGSMLTLNAAGAIALDANITAAAGGLTLDSGGTISATGAVSVARFTLGGGNWVQNTATLPGFAAGDFRITGGSFLRAAGGDGSSGSPYNVGDVYGLQGIGSSASLLGDNFQLANDVDASGTSAWNAGAGFVPIGNTATQFTGSLTGAGHVISNLFINQPSISYIGLIGYLGSAGTISDIGMVGGSITGQGVVGGLVGRNDGTVSQSYATGAVNGSGYVGGLIGYNHSTVSQSYATGAVNGSSEVGGLVGYSSSTVSQSYATGAVNGSGYVGGLVGTNASNGTVSQSYATGAVNGSSNVGGLVGYNYSTVSQSYATGAVNGSFNVGGLNVGGLVGYSFGTVSQSYWDTQTTGQTIGIGGGGSTAGATGLTTAAARNSTNYASWDFAGIWYQAGDMRPILRSEAAVPVAGVITVSNLHQLELVNINLLGSYRLTADIDASLTSSSNPAGIFGATGFVPIGKQATYFYGSLTGAGHVISNLFINQPSSRYVGLVGILGYAGTISGLGMVGGSITGQSNVGGLVGASGGTVSQSYATGAVNGDEVGGLVGQNFGHGTVSQSYATGAVSGSQDVGGLVGYNVNNGTVSQSYATGAVNGSSNVGGLVGSNDSNGTVSQSYATGAVNGSGYVGGLVGYNRNSTVSQSYATGAIYAGVGSIAVGGLVGVNFTGTVSQSYATGAVNSVNGSGGDVGGLVGYSDGTVSQSYATGAVNSPNISANNRGGLVALNYGTVSQSYWDTQTTGQTTGIGAGSTAGATGLTTGQMQDVTLFRTTFAGFDFDTVWAPPSDAAHSSDGLAHYPELYALSNIVGVIAGGTHLYGDSMVANYLGLHTGDFVTVPGTSNVNASSTANIGSYAVSYSGVIAKTASGGAYRIVYVPGTETITARPITLAADAIARTYGDTNPLLTYTVGGSGLVNGDALTGGLATTATASSNVNGYAIIQGNLAASSNYAVTYQGATLTVTPRALTITPDAISRLYGDATPTSGTATANNLVHGDKVTQVSLTTPATVASNVGNFDLTGSAATGRGLGNYTITYATLSGGLGITTRPITLTADGITRIYGDANPLLTYTVGGLGLVNGDALTGGLATTATATSNVNGYAITQGNLAASSNYAVTYQGATLTVTPRALTVTPDALSRLYGDANPASGTATANNLVNGDSVTQVSLTTPATVTSNVGNFDLTGSAATGIGLGNYTITYATRSLGLGITARPITLTADAISRIYGDANPLLTYTVGGSGLVNGDTLTGGLATTATATSNVNGYAITQGNLAASSNYAVTYQGATLTVTPRALTVTPDALSRIYGDANPLLTYTVGGLGLVNGDALTGGLATTATATSNVNGYAITQGNLAASSNYAVTYQGATLTVTPRALTVTPDALSRLYGDANPASGTATANNLINGDSVTQVSLTTPATVTSNVGNFDLTGSAATGIGLGNYTITYATRSLGLGITARPITLTADAISRTYGGANPALTYTVGGSGLVNGDALTGGLATTATATSNVNGYAIIQGNLAASSNYAVTYQGATLTVTPRAIVITADDQLRYFGDANPVLTYTVGGSGLVNGDALSGALDVNAGRTSVPATYQIQKATLAASANYALTYIPGILTVQPSRAVPVALVAGTLIRDAFATDTRPALYAASLVDSDHAQNGEKGVLTSSSKITPTFCPKEQICSAVGLKLQSGRGARKTEK